MTCQRFVDVLDAPIQSNVVQMVGIVTIVRECMVEGKLTDALSIETYWPKLCGTYAAFKMNNTHGPWFSLEVVNEANLS